MWSVVAVAMVGMITGWGMLFHWELGAPQNAVFKDLQNAITKFTSRNKPAQSSTNKEVQDLTQQIFPQFQK
jgi:hypothetical protein